MSHRKAFFSLLFCLTLLQPEQVHAQEREQAFPYQALVINDGATVHSGPGSVHYATDKLKLDATIDVYRHDPGGWCAIRPPSTSFSLVPEAVVERIADNVGKIREDGVQAWVGTRLGTVERPLWQVKLRQDEEVRILGEVSWPNPDGDSTIWFQIAPPAGEFRWIRISDLRLPKHVTDLPEVVSGSATLIQTDLATDELDVTNTLTQSVFQTTDPTFAELSLDPPSEKNATINRGWKKARQSIRVADRRIGTGHVEPFKTPSIDTQRRSENVSSFSNNTSPLRNGGFQKQPDLATGPATGPSTAANADIRRFEPIEPISGPVSVRIRKLEKVLTAEMVKPPAEWELESLLRQTTAIASATNDLTERSHAERLTKKIRNCANIQSNYASAYAVGSQSGLPVRQVEINVDSDVQLGTTYDAFGWLNELVRDNGKMTPTYVLENDEGKIKYHIAPSPGLNLSRYLKSKVGVIGRRGFHQELQLDHVTAERVIVLDKLRR